MRKRERERERERESKREGEDGTREERAGGKRASRHIKKETERRW